jgi:hypothetical protein
MDEYFTMKMRICMISPDFERSFLISNVGSVNCTDRLNYRIQITENVICPPKFVTKLLEMMRLTRIVEITVSRGDTTTICVKESNYLCEQIMTAIKRTIAKTYYPNISKVDAQEIITRLRIKERDIYYIDGDEFGCLVVLHELNRESCQYDYHRLPYVLFKQKYEEINQSRTIFMTRIQYQKFFDDQTRKSSVEFPSVLPDPLLPVHKQPDRPIEVVFRQDADKTIFGKIKRLVEIDNLELTLAKLKSSSK